MKNTQAFFEKIFHHYQNKRPFVCFSKQGQLKAYLQTDEEVYAVEHFKTPGFVFCPFSSGAAKLIFPAEKSQIMTSNLGSEGLAFKPKTIQLSTGKLKHVALVAKAIQQIKTSKVRKIVCSRKIKLNYEAEPLLVFKRLAHKYPDAFSYVWYHPKVGLWLGATPEQFLYLDRNRLQTVALAGTIDASLHPDPQWSSKELEEQQMVTDFILKALEKNAAKVKVKDTETLRAGQLWHLKTAISAEIQMGNLNKIISDLHPTSAVCGLPKQEAEEFITTNEHYDRQYYAGFLGEMHVKQEIKRKQSSQNQEQMAIKSIKRVSDLYVNLRCMQVFEDYVEIYVGGGITKDSSPSAEYEETVAKSQTLLRVL